MLDQFTILLNARVNVSLEMSTYSDLLFWSKWTSLSFELHEFAVLASDVVSLNSIARHRVLDQQLALEHINSKYGFCLESLHFVLIGFECELLNPATEGDLKSLAELSLVIGDCYELMFDSALVAPFFDQDRGEYKVSADLSRVLLVGMREVIQGNDSAVLTEWLNQAHALAHQYKSYISKSQSHNTMSKKRTARSESFRLESEVLREKNATLVLQYIGQTEMPLFVVNMLLDYWALKMSVVQRLGQLSVHDWQYYWTFVTRIVRYFKNSEATTRTEVLNHDFDFLYEYFVEEVGESHFTFEMRKFIQQFKAVHLEKLESVHLMKKSKRPKSHFANLSLSSSSLPSTCQSGGVGRVDSRVEVGTQWSVGALFWYECDHLVLPCEIILAPMKSSHEYYVVSFYGGDGLLSFRVSEFEAALSTGQLTRRMTAKECHLEVDASSGSLKRASA